MDKGKLIKEINTLHSLVKATRNTIIRKLMRDNKVWAAKATANSSNQRAKRKAESSAATLNHIKSIPPSVLIEEMLQYQPLKNGESLESTSLAHRSIARFLLDPKLNRYLKSLENQLGADANSKLLVTLQQKRKIKSSVAKNQRKQRIRKVLETKKEKRKEQRNRSNLAKKKADVTKILETDGPDSSHGTDDEDIKRTSVCDSYESDDDSEGFDKELVESEESENGEESAHRGRLSISVSGDEDDSSDEEAIKHCVDEPQVKTHGKEKRNDPPRLSKPSIVKSDRSDTQITKNPIKKKEVNYKAPEEEDEKDGYEMITDSFFVTNTGERYVAVAPKLNPQTEDDVESGDNEKSWKITNTRKRRDQQLEENDKTAAFDTDLKQLKQRKVTSFPKGKSTINEKPYTPGSSSVKNQDLHPSWAAKQAQKGIKPFAGKKVVFDAEDDNGTSSTPTQKVPTRSNAKNSDLHPSWAAKQAQKGIKPFAGKKVVFDAEDDNGNSSTHTQKDPARFSTKNDDLHPSWAAKQAQKGIKPFAGKKVVFDAEDDNGNSSTHTQKVPARFSTKNDDLHPSWAAKQAQKGIKPFAGKKVVFDAEDDNGTSLTHTQKAPTSSTAKNGDLHPSWAAKQAQKGIKPFAGKKTVFDAENTNDVGKTISKKCFDRSNDLHPSWVAKQAQSGIKSFNGKKTVFDDEGGNGDKTNSTIKAAPKTSLKNDLHPSWAAKQAQNGIKPFAGKKTTFNTVDASKRDKPVAIKQSSTAKASKSSDLHPSWAAKQAQKAILPFAGKKITFGNEDSAENITKVTGFRTGSAQRGSKHYANSNDGPKSQPSNNATLHPSWAAKQAQNGIKPFAGTKISFDD